MKLRELLAKRRELQEQGQGYLAIVKQLGAKGDLSAEDQAELEKAQAEIAKLTETLAALDVEIEQANELADAERTFAVNPATVAYESITYDQLGVEQRVLDAIEQRRGETAGFDNVADFALAVRAAGRQGSGDVDERLAALGAGQLQAAPTNFHQETGSNEGYMVPPAFRNEIFELAFSDEDLLGAVDTEPTGSNSVGFLKDETTPWGSSGVQANWSGEGKKFDPSKIETGMEQMKLYKLLAFVLATEELLEDAPRLANRLTRRAGEAIRWVASEAIMHGDGVGKPLGWMKSGALVTVAKESGQAANTINVANVSKMYSRMMGSSISRARWYANIDIFPQLVQLTVGDTPIWTPPVNGIREAPGGFLFGRPLQWTEHANTLGTLGDIQFVDPLGYTAATKSSGIKFSMSMHLYFDYDMQAFRWTFRVAGQPMLSAPVGPAKGTSSKSHFVALATRA